MTNKTELKRNATTLLRRYDKMRRELRNLEQELHQACVAYGRAEGYTGWYNKDSLRIALIVEKEQKDKAEREAERLERAAQRHEWEQANAG